MVFERHIFLADIWQHSGKFKLLYAILLLVCTVMLDLYLDYSRHSVEHICSVVQAYLLRGI